MKRWYVVRTQPRSEASAVWHLRNQGFEAYLPRYRAERRHARRVEPVLRSLFPRYLFVRIDLESERWRSINGTVGVTHIVCQGARPAPVPEGVVEAIMAREDESGLVKLTPPAFRAGEPIRITGGALANLVGRFQELEANQRVVLLMELLGRTLRVRVPVDMVAAQI